MGKYALPIEVEGTIQHQAMEIMNLRAKLAEAEKDAARYRWLRDGPVIDIRSALAAGAFVKLDTAIDAAMKEQSRA